MHILLQSPNLNTFNQTKSAQIYEAESLNCNYKANLYGIWYLKSANIDAKITIPK